MDTIEATARIKGECTYYLGTYAVARNTIVHAGLTCSVLPYEEVAAMKVVPDSGHLRWKSFMGDDWEELTRQQAIEVLIAERS